MSEVLILEEAFFDWREVTEDLRKSQDHDLLYLPANRDILQLFGGDPAPGKPKALFIKFRYANNEALKNRSFVRVYHELGSRLDNVILLGFPRTVSEVPPVFQMKEFYRGLFHLQGTRRYLEIGGPSPSFDDPRRPGSSPNSLDIYSRIDGKERTLDNLIFGQPTSEMKDFTINGKICGKTIMMDSTNIIDHLDSYSPLSPLSSLGSLIVSSSTKNEQVLFEESYDNILTSHCLQRIANPLKAFFGWKRLLKIGGYLLVIVPWKEGTFDHRRDYTSFDHILNDYTQNIQEDDLTHLPEILELHDLSRDLQAGDIVNFRQRCLDNQKIRGMHQHLFTYSTLIEMGTYVGMKVIDMEISNRYDILMVFQRTA